MALTERRSRSLFVRLWDKFRVGDGCWEWTASRTSHGYGQIAGGHGKPLFGHRVIYELLKGPIPAGLQIDHLCRNRGCVNPAHLEPVTQAENKRRGMGGPTRAAVLLARTHCKHGHEWSIANTYMDCNANGNPRRNCRRCKADPMLAANRRKKELASSH